MKACAWIVPLAAMALMLAALASAQDQGAAPASAQDQTAELAKKLANPVANLISVPLQYNYDENYGPDDEGSYHRLNIQPVIPFSLNDRWKLVTRTIVPLISQSDIPARGQDESGLGDVLASQFFSPKEPTAGGWIWGLGPAELLPTATDDLLGSEKWGLGPTAVVVKQTGPWTVGFLTNHIWSVGGEDDRADMNSTFLQPFLSYVTRTKTTIGLNTESTYDWEAEQWSVPVNLTVSQLLKIGPQMLQVALGGRYWADSPDNGAEDWGLRFGVTFLFPK